MFTLLKRLATRRTARMQPVDQSWIKRVREAEQQFLGASTTELRAGCDRLRENAQSRPEQVLDNQHLTTAVGLVAAAAQQTLGIRFHDVQLVAGLALARLGEVDR